MFTILAKYVSLAIDSYLQCCTNWAYLIRCEMEDFKEFQLSLRLKPQECKNIVEYFHLDTHLNSSFFWIWFMIIKSTNKSWKTTFQFIFAVYITTIYQHGFNFMLALELASMARLASCGQTWHWLITTNYINGWHFLIPSH